MSSLYIYFLSKRLEVTVHYGLAGQTPGAAASWLPPAAACLEEGGGLASEPPFTGRNVRGV